MNRNALNALALVGLIGATAVAQSTPADDGFEGYDFGQVVEAMETSVNPLQTEMDRSFRVFIETIEEAEALLDAGDTQQAVQKATVALDGVLAVRDVVLEPMWEGQQALTEQIAVVRARLAEAVQASSITAPVGPDEETEATLDALAGRIAGEPDPLRKRRLTAHYKAVRNLARIKALAGQLSPDQRKMWMSVLHVLDEAALVHQQLMMGSEVLFAQFETTSDNLKSLLSLMETVDGASNLIDIVRGSDGLGAGMAGFAESMLGLQDRLAGFNTSVEQALEMRMLELEAQIDSVQPLTGDMTFVDETTLDADAELAARIARVAGGTP